MKIYYNNNKKFTKTMHTSYRSLKDKNNRLESKFKLIIYEMTICHI